MIKKSLKTLDELQNPTKSVPPYYNTEGRWRIWVDDTFIDTYSLRDRDTVLNRLTNLTNYNGRVVNVDFIPNRVQSNVTLDFNISATPTKLEHPFKKLLKEKIGKWDWQSFFSMSMITFIFGFISGSIMYFSRQPKNDITYLDSVIGSTFIGLGLCTLLWVTDKILKLLPFITCWFKILTFIILFLFIGITIGFLMSENTFDKIMSFIAKHIITDNELKVLRAATEND